MLLTSRRAELFDKLSTYMAAGRLAACWVGEWPTNEPENEELTEQQRQLYATGYKPPDPDPDDEAIASHIRAFQASYDEIMARDGKIEPAEYRPPTLSLDWQSHDADEDAKAT